MRFSDGYTVPIENVQEQHRREQSIQISVRPEEFIVSTDATQGVPAKVSDSIFLGLNTHYKLTLHDGTEVETIQESSIDSIIPKGTEVFLQVKAEKINIFSEDGSVNLLRGVHDDKRGAE